MNKLQSKNRKSIAARTRVLERAVSKKRHLLLHAIGLCKQLFTGTVYLSQNLLDQLVTHCFMYCFAGLCIIVSLSLEEFGEYYASIN